MNLYSFVYNSPQDWFDDLGHKPRQQREEKREARNQENRQNRLNNQNAAKTTQIERNANRGAATPTEPAGAAASAASAAAGVPGEIVKHGPKIVSTWNSVEAELDCIKKAKLAFQFEDHFFGSREKLCCICCIRYGHLSAGGWDFWRNEIHKGKCTKEFWLEMVREFEKIEWIGEGTATIYFQEECR